MSAPPRATRRSEALARCLDPFPVDEFFEQHWEQQPLLISRDESARFEDLLSPAEIELLLCSGGLRYPAFRLVKAGSQISLGDYTKDVSWRPKPFGGMAEPEQVAAHFADGATIVLQALHHNRLPVARFCRELEQALGHPVQANSYYTPRASQGFAVHHDTHDVFILQCAGEKRWLVYDPILELPLKNQRWSRDLGRPGPVVMDVTLRAGDTLYLPRGWLHEALTSESDSLHLTVGVVLYAWIDAVREALDACADDVEFRRSVQDAGELPAELVSKLAAQLSPDAVSSRRRRRLIATRRPILDGQLSEALAAADVDGETLLERRDTVLAELDGDTLRFDGKELTFPEQSLDELQAIVEAEQPFRAADLPGDLDVDGRLVLLRRLIREGFVRRTAAAG